MRSALVLAASLLAASPALASPWTLPRGDLALSAWTSVQTARQEFFESGGARNFPLNGRYNGTTLGLTLRAGITDRLELEFGLPIRTVSYQSDPVVLNPQPPGSTESPMDYYQRNVINLSRNDSGIGDLTLAGRYRLLLEPLAMALELRFKFPSGYPGPSGTFGDEPRSAATFLADASRYASPENVRDDVTLGDGQVDITPSILLGYAFPTRTFLRLDAGYNVRLGAAGHQVVGAFRAGQFIGDVVLLYAWVQAAVNVTRGRVIGVSVAAQDPDLPAAQYVNDNNLLLRELRLERSNLDVGGGVIVRFTPSVELNLGYSRTLWGQNTAVVDQVFVSLGARTTLPGVTR